MSDLGDGDPIPCMIDLTSTSLKHETINLHSHTHLRPQRTQTVNFEVDGGHYLYSPQSTAAVWSAGDRLSSRVSVPWWIAIVWWVVDVLKNDEILADICACFV